MTARLARLALRLYPLAYRRRYGEEMLALLEDEPPRARAVLDLLRGALLAHLRPADGPSGVVDPTDRVRAGIDSARDCPGECIHVRRAADQVLVAGPGTGDA